MRGGAPPETPMQIARATYGEARWGQMSTAQRRAAAQEQIVPAGAGRGSMMLNPDTRAGLPDGWTAHEDPSTNKTYYVDMATKITTWERPGGGAPAGGAPAGAPLWHEAVDPASGKPYYVNSKTKETSWTKPPATLGPQSFEREFELSAGREPPALLAMGESVITCPPPYI